MLNEEISNDVENEVAKPAVRLAWEMIGKPTAKKLIGILHTVLMLILMNCLQ